MKVPHTPTLSAALGPRIFRQVAFSLAAFDRFKDYQRALEQTEGHRLSNSEVLDRLILTHPAA